jgi:transposase-like protein
MSMDAHRTLAAKSDENRPPETRDGRANALQHGLAGTKSLPPTLRPGRVDEIYQRLRQDIAPKSFLDELTLREIARHAAILDVIEVGEPAVLRQAANGMASLVAADGDAGDDVALALAVTAEPLERVSRYRRAHEKALHSALDRIVARRQPVDETKPPAAPKDRRFSTTAECEAFLQERFSSATWKCPYCGSRTGSYRERRKAWTCASCDRGVGLRQGTIFARSGIPLATWFRAIDLVAADLHIDARELAERLDSKRVATVRNMLHRIHGALTSSVMVRPGTTPLQTILNFVHLDVFSAKREVRIADAPPPRKSITRP